MLYIVFAALLIIAAVGLWVTGTRVKATSTGADGSLRTDTDQYLSGRLLRWGGGICLATFVFLTVGSMVHQVPVGNVGLVYTFGNITGQTDSGLVTTAPWQDLKTANVKTQKETFDLSAFSKETQDAFVTATLNYHVNPQDIQRLYRNVGSGWFTTLVPTRVNQAFKDETVKFNAVDIAPNRDVIRADVLRRLKNELAQYSIQVDDLNIDNISFSKQFTNAIEDKQIATQEAAAAQNRVARAKAEAESLIRTAQGQAEANRLKQRTLTPLLVQQNAIDKLNPNVKVIVVPAGGNFLLGNLLNGNNK